jgi:hypothetical protein
MAAMDGRALAPGLIEAIERSGYYPAVVTDMLATALAGEPVRSWLVQHEATFDRDELRRHVSALVLTPTRLVVGHVDEHPPDETCPSPYAAASTEAVSLASVASVVVSRIVADPATHKAGAPPREILLTLGWGAVSRLDLEPAGCGDPDCDADHGYTGVMSSDDFSLRISEVADGADTVAQALAFAEAVSEATGHARS